MRTRRAFVVIFLCLFTGIGVTLASTLEEKYIKKSSWIPTIAGDIQNAHNSWHQRLSLSASDDKGREFLEFHRELLAQSDDFRIYGSDMPLEGEVDDDPDAAVIPLLALPGPPWDLRNLIKFRHGDNGTCWRPQSHPIDDGQHGTLADPLDPLGNCHAVSYWTGRPANLILGTPEFHAYTNHDAENDIGVHITRDFHNQGHGAVSKHRPTDIFGPLGSTKDGAFWQWHKNIDNIYADWAIGQYQLANRSGRPIFFSVSESAVGAEGSSLKERRGSNVYQGAVGAARDPATQYGAFPRIASDIYVGDNDSKNLLYAAGTRKWQLPSDPSPIEAWDVDAWSILNRDGDGWYFSVTMGSVGAAGAVADPLNLSKGGDVFESAGDPIAATNAMYREEAPLGLAADATDELDALEVDQQRRVQGTNDSNTAGVFDRPKQWFSLRLGFTHGVMALPKAGPPAVPVDPSDILHFNSNGDLEIEVSHTVLGLLADGVDADDDLDALAIVDNPPSNTFDDGDFIYYSLASGSPSLDGASAADILCKTKIGGACAGVGHASLGLAFGDDLDALDRRRIGGGGGGLALAQQVTITGACCRLSPPPATSFCEEVSDQNACQALGGTYAGDDTACDAVQCPSAPGACCVPSGMCTFVSDRDCLLAAGTFRGPGTTCPPSPACPMPPANDECVNAIAIPYTFTNGYDPMADNTNATIPHYSLHFTTTDDPIYSCHDHNVFSGEFGSGTIWYSYTVPPGPSPGRSIYIDPRRNAQFYPYGVCSGSGASCLTQAGCPSGQTCNVVAGDTRLALYYSSSGNCSTLQEVACADNFACDDPSEEPYAPLRYDNPAPGRYYVQVSTTFNVDRGRVYLSVSDPPAEIPAVSYWGLAALTLVLIGAGAILLRLRSMVAA